MPSDVPWSLSFLHNLAQSKLEQASKLLSARALSHFRSPEASHIVPENNYLWVRVASAWARLGATHFLLMTWTRRGQAYKGVPSRGPETWKTWRRRFNLIPKWTWDLLRGKEWHGRSCPGALGSGATTELVVLLLKSCSSGRAQDPAVRLSVFCRAQAVKTAK